jgi:hypothetical protein
LPLADLERVYNVRLTEGQKLGFDDFKAECLHGLSFWDMSGFGKRAAFLFFVDPAETTLCKEWFVKCANVLKAVVTTKGQDLADVIQYIWGEKVLSRPLQLNFTLDAMRRLDEEKKTALCLALYEAYPEDAWIKAYLPRPPGMDMSALGRSAKPLPKIESERWHPRGSIAECRMCGFRPRDNILFSFSMQVSSLATWQTHYCTTCTYRTLKLKLVPNSASAESLDRTVRDAFV